MQPPAVTNGKRTRLGVVTRNTDIDTGYSWLVLAACFLIRCLTEGFWSSMGILLVEWQTYFDASARDVAIIGSMALAVLYLSAPFAAALSNRLSFRLVAISGGVMILVSMLAISFANQLWHIYLIITITGIGMGLALQISCVFFVFYFDKRLGFANGICSSGSPIGTLALAPLFQFLIDEYGWRGTTLITSAIMAHVIMCAIVLKSSSSERQKQDGASRSIWREIASDFEFSLWFRNGRFVFGALNGLWIGSGYNTAVIYIVPYAVHDIGITKMKASFLLSIFGISSLVGRLCHGWLIDKRIILPTQLNVICWLVSGATMMFVPISKSYFEFAALLAIFGFFSGIGHSLIFLIIRNAVGTQYASNGYAWFLTWGGIGALSGVYIAGYLYDVTSTYIHTFHMAGGALICACLFTLADYVIERCQIKKANNKDKGVTMTTHLNGNVYDKLGQTDQKNTKILLPSVRYPRRQFHYKETEI